MMSAYHQQVFEGASFHHQGMGIPGGSRGVSNDYDDALLLGPFQADASSFASSACSPAAEATAAAGRSSGRGGGDDRAYPYLTSMHHVQCEAALCPAPCCCCSLSPVCIPQPPPAYTPHPALPQPCAPRPIMQGLGRSAMHSIHPVPFTLDPRPCAPHLAPSRRLLAQHGPRPRAATAAGPPGRPLGWGLCR